MLIGATLDCAIHCSPCERCHHEAAGAGLIRLLINLARRPSGAQHFNHCYVGSWQHVSQRSFLCSELLRLS
jgi:hypothetical protein